MFSVDGGVFDVSAGVMNIFNITHTSRAQGFNLIEINVTLMFVEVDGNRRRRGGREGICSSMDVVSAWNERLVGVRPRVLGF